LSSDDVPSYPNFHVAGDTNDQSPLLGKELRLTDAVIHIPVNAAGRSADRETEVSDTHHHEAGPAVSRSLLPGMQETSERRQAIPIIPDCSMPSSHRLDAATCPATCPSDSAHDGRSRRDSAPCASVTARHIAISRSGSQKIRDALFGASDEELSDISDVESLHESSDLPKQLFQPMSTATAARNAPRAGASNGARNAVSALGDHFHADSHPHAHASDGLTQEPKLASVVTLKGRKILDSQDQASDVAQSSLALKKAPKKKRVAMEKSDIEDNPEQDSNLQSRKPESVVTGTFLDATYAGESSSLSNRPTRTSAVVASKRIAESTRNQVERPSTPHVTSADMATSAGSASRKSSGRSGSSGTVLNTSSFQLK